MMDAREEMLTLLQKLWAKLQDLPTASPLEMGAFAVLVIFIGILPNPLCECCHLSSI
uniref:Small integral membrane protein 5 n=1 Tax=Salmo trutta TaxID=8032 RepID=A0A673WYE7_SALTR